MEGTRLVSNQLGYPQQWVEHYDPRFVIEMEAGSTRESPQVHEAVASEEYTPPVCNPYGTDHAANEAGSPLQPSCANMV